MINNNFLATDRKCFAAANGFSGFRSYFKDVFEPTEYDAIYILKGGPGTGKSSFMKKLFNAFSKTIDSYELIYCSSDIASLDGLILRKGDKQIAVLDGTAPHATDPTMPGAIEEIINLGENWSRDILQDSRELVIKHNNQKSFAYEMAYSYLALCGNVTSTADGLINKIYNVSDADVISSLINSVDSGVGNRYVRLLNAFGKDGFVRLDISEKGTDVKRIVGVYGSEYIFMENLKRSLDYKNADYIRFPAPLDHKKTDAIYIISRNKLIITEPSSRFSPEDVIDTSAFLDKTLLRELRERLEFLWHEREGLLWSSVDEFKKASDEHFKLEKIYTASMDFEAIDKKLEYYASRIAKILGISL